MEDIREVYSAAVLLKSKMKEINEALEVVIRFLEENMKNNSAYKLKRLQEKDK